MKRSLLLAALILALGQTASAQFQKIIDQPQEGLGIIAVLPAPDGGTYLAQRASGNDDLLTLLRLDPSGEPLWKRSIMHQGGYLARSFKPLQSSGSRCASILEGYSSNNQTVIPDTSILRYGFTTIDENGEIVSAVTCERIMIDLSPTIVIEDVLEMAVHPDGGWYFLNDYNTPETQELYRMSASGDLLWCRSIGRPAPSIMFPTFGEAGMVNNIGATRLFCTADGDALILSMAELVQGALKVKKISPAGDILWVRTYQLLNSNTYGRLLSAELDANGDLHAVVRINYPNSVLLLFKIAADGTLLTVDAVNYDTPTGYQLLLDPSGDHYLASTTTPPGDYLTKLSSGGSGLVTVHPGMPQPDYTYSPHFQTWSLEDGIMRVACNLTKENNLLGTTVDYPTVWKFPTAAYEPCSSYSFATSYVPVSLDNFVVTEDPEIIAVDITDQTNAFVSTGTSSGLTPYPMYDMCDLSVGLAPASGLAKAHLASNLVLAGEPLTLLDKDAVAVEIRTIDGRLVLPMTRSGSARVIPTTGYASGLYVIRAMGKEARQLWCETVVMQ